jgi:hypothetical protein
VVATASSAAGTTVATASSAAGTPVATASGALVATALLPAARADCK